MLQYNIAKFMPILLVSGGAALATVGAADSHDLSREIGVIGGNTLGPDNLNACPLKAQINAANAT